jgi:hypothetical protein
LYKAEDLEVTVGVVCVEKTLADLRAKTFLASGEVGVAGVAGLVSKTSLPALFGDLRKKFALNSCQAALNSCLSAGTRAIEESHFYMTTCLIVILAHNANAYFYVLSQCECVHAGREMGGGEIEIVKESERGTPRAVDQKVDATAAKHAQVLLHR